MRVVARSELPSTRQATTLTFSSVLNLFMCIIYLFMLERSSIFDKEIALEKLNSFNCFGVGRADRGQRIKALVRLSLPQLVY
jgi:hypothetical protein